jgi:hypothetical protein
MRVVVLLVVGACGGSAASITREEEAPVEVEPELASADPTPPPPWRLEASGAREDTMFRVDVVAYAREAKARSTWSESALWRVEAETAGRPMKRLVCGPARIEERTDTGEVVVRFAVYFEAPQGKAAVALRVAPPGGHEERVSLELDEAETWRRLEGAGGPRTFAPGSLAAGRGALFALDGKRLLRSIDEGRSWNEAPGLPPGEAVQSIASSDERVVVATQRGLYASADGASWSRLERPAGRTRLQLLAAGARLVAVGDRRRIACSSDGMRWQEPQRPLRGRIQSAALAGKAVLVAVSSGSGRGAVHRSIDGCRSFRTVTRGDSLVADGDVAVAAAGDSLVHSEDGGASWQEIPAPAPRGSYHLAMVDGHPVAGVLDPNFPAAVVRYERSGWQRVQRGGLPRVKGTPVLLPAGDSLYLVADRSLLWALEKRLVR